MSLYTDESRMATAVVMALLPVTAGVDVADFARRLAAQLGRMGKVCLVDADVNAWTQRCSRHSDDILLLADASQPPVLHATATTWLMQRGGQSDAAQILVLLHDGCAPRGWRTWGCTGCCRSAA